MFIDGLDYLWIIVMFLSAVWAHSDGTHSLHVMLNLSKSTSFSKFLFFGRTIPLNKEKSQYGSKNKLHCRKLRKTKN